VSTASTGTPGTRNRLPASSNRKLHSVARSGEIALEKTMMQQTMKTGPIAVVLLLGSLLNQPLVAEDSLELEHVLVTARIEPISVGDIGSSVTVITREEIEKKQVRYLSDLLRDVPGFSVSQSGGAGSQTQVRVRGAEANQLLVLMDGVRANDPAASGEFQYQFALTSNIERIEIIRGPQSQA